MTIGTDSALHRIFEAVDAINTTASRYDELLKPYNLLLAKIYVCMIIKAFNYV